MKKTQLSKAIALALTGAVTAVAGISTAQAGSTGYNAFNHDVSAPWQIVGGNTSAQTAPGGNGTDGWLLTYAQDPDPLGVTPGSTYTTDGHSYGDGPAGGNNAAFGGAVVEWVGLNPYSAMGFAPQLVAGTNKAFHTLNWAAQINGAGDSVTISKTDSQQYAGTALADGTTFNYADIDTAKGAWHDNLTTGWKHDTDIGLFRSDTTQLVTLNIASLLGSGDVNQTPEYGISIFTGMTGGQSGLYSHHAGWHAVTPAAADGVLGSGPLEAAGVDISPNNPFGGTGETFLLDDVLNNNATFLAQAGQIYTIYVGGFQGGSWTETRNNYQLSITGTSPVPVPGAAWLFGGAIASLIGANRRKRVVPA